MDQNKAASHNIEWKIKNVTKEALTDGKSVFLSDIEIPFKNDLIKWYIRAKIKDSKLALHLFLREPKITGFLTRFEAFIRTLNNEKESNFQFEKDYSTFEGGYGQPSFISIAYLFENSDRFLKNEILTIGAKIELIKKLEESKDNKTSISDSKYVTAFKDYFDTKSYSDLTFVCSDETKIKAHRFVLAAFSPVLKKIFDVGSICIIKVNDIDGKTMTEILRYIYTENVNDIEENAPKLLYGADKYKLNDLKDLCAATMIENLSIECVLDYFVLADQYGIKDLLNHCIQFTRTHQKVLIANEENWNKLKKKHLNMLLINYQENIDYIQVRESSF